MPCVAATTLAPPLRSNAEALRLPGRIRRKQTRWHLIGVAVLLAATWLGLAYLQTGGHPFQQLAALRGGAPPVVTELPFSAPSRAADQPRRPQPATNRRVHTYGGRLQRDASKSAQ